MSWITFEVNNLKIVFSCLWEKSEMMNKALFQIYACKNLHDRNLRSSMMLRGGDW